MTKAIVDADVCSYAVGFATQTPFFLVFHESEPDIPVAQFDDKETAVAFADRSGEGYTCQKLFEPHSIGLVNWHTDQYVERILEGCGADEFELWLTAPDLNKNFRKKLCSEYKENRKDFQKPINYEAVRERLIDYWGAKVVPEGLEADDVVSIKAWEFWDRMKEAADLTYVYESDQYLNDLGHTPIISSVDKDLDTCPGWRYSWETHNKPEQKYFVTEEEARHTFWVSVLTGDRADHILGLDKIGPKRAASQLQHCETDKEYYEKCRTLYEAHDRLEDLDKNCALLYLLRSQDDSWESFKERFLNE